MRRKIEQRLLRWKDKRGALPLLLFGARQVGKTYSVRAFGREHFANTAYINFQTDLAHYAQAFSGPLKPAAILERLELLTGSRISPEDTLIVFDEVQLCQPALTALKYFAEDAPQYRIIATGSLFGITVGREQQYSFPVGKVDLAHMYPLDFEEFLMATGREVWIEGIRDCYAASRDFIAHDEALAVYRQYLMVGGMPAAVRTFLDGGGYQEVREVQANISLLYVADMNLYLDAADAVRARSVWESAPRQLAREASRKFKLADMHTGARAKDYEKAMAWLEGAGLVYRHRQVQHAIAPLEPRGNGSFYKTYLLDCGILAQRMGIRPQVFLDDAARQQMSSGYRGGMAENYVKQALTANSIESCYWSGGYQREVDFVFVDDMMRVVPIEVKSAKNTGSKSLDSYREQYKPAHSIRISANRFGDNNGLKTVPPYAAFCVNGSPE